MQIMSCGFPLAFLTCMLFGSVTQSIDVFELARRLAFFGGDIHWHPPHLGFCAFFTKIQGEALLKAAMA